MATAIANYEDAIVAEISGVPAGTRWSWACRVLASRNGMFVTLAAGRQPRAGDLALVQVEAIGSHERITTHDNARLRIYPGDYIVGVFGNRYATDAYEAVIEGRENLSLLTAGGMIGTVRSRHRAMGRPTTVKLVGLLSGADGVPRNLPQMIFRPAEPVRPARNLVAVVGTGMNAGKTTSCVHLIKSLSSQGVRVAACKLTGSVSNRDQDEMKAAGAVKVLDFSDYGFPSTYLMEKDELLTLYRTLMADLEVHQPDIVVMEIADGVLQRETKLLLEDAWLRQQLSGVMLAADNALSARYGVDLLERMGHRVLGVTGLLTSSPLCMREFGEICPLPVAASAGALGPLGSLVKQQLGLGGV
jgi:hypothetical protein